MPKTKPIGTIEDDTGIVVEIAAEAVVNKAADLLGRDLPADVLAAYLAGHAEATYQASPSFRKKVRSNADHGNRGRDLLYAFMQHWLSSKLVRESDGNPAVRRALVDSGFSSGAWD